MNGRLHRFPLAWAAVAALTVACATEPGELSQVRTAYEQMAANGRVQEHAGVEIHDAELAVKEAERVWHDNGNYDEAVHLAYLATRRVELAWLAAERRELSDEMTEFPQQIVNRALGVREQTAASQQTARRLAMHLSSVEDLSALLEQLDATPEERGVLTLGDVLFGFDSAVLRPGADEAIALLAEFLLTHPARSLLVEGHTDDSGVLEYNFDLSRRRAEAVKAELVEAGVPPERVTTVGYGPVYPVATNAVATGRAQNRRVEVVVLGHGEQLEAR
ncbi:MAG: OmpA family protein [Myxococcota bacterium]|nr:OmpA family protein [Myxococcota bacterium]